MTKPNHALMDNHHAYRVLRTMLAPAEYTLALSAIEKTTWRLKCAVERGETNLEQYVSDIVAAQKKYEDVRERYEATGQPQKIREAASFVSLNHEWVVDRLSQSDAR